MVLKSKRERTVNRAEAGEPRKQRLSSAGDKELYFRSKPCSPMNP